MEKALRFAQLSQEYFRNMGEIEGLSHMSQNQKEKHLDRWIRMTADTHALILFKQGDLKQALKYQKEAVGDGKNNAYNERYLEILLADEQYEKAVTEAAGLIEINSAGAKIKDFYKEAYINSKGSSSGLEESMAKLKKKAYGKALKDLRNEMLNEEAPDFRLVDMDGNEIILSSLKGKTVILDFWATWCIRCIDAFSGMQIAVDKYKDDPDVVFLFVNTFENGKDIYAAMKKLLEKNNYSFQVVIDRETEDDNRYKTAKDFRISGLPTKIIIGPDGKIRFKKTGEMGDDEKMVQDLEIMVDLLKIPAEAPAKKEPVASF